MNFEHHTSAHSGLDYFIRSDGKALCLYCSDTSALPKYNICGNYQTKHPSQYSQHTGKQQPEQLNILNGISQHTISWQKKFTISL